MNKKYKAIHDNMKVKIIMGIRKSKEKWQHQFIVSNMRRKKGKINEKQEKKKKDMSKQEKRNGRSGRKIRSTLLNIFKILTTH